MVKVGMLGGGLIAKTHSIMYAQMKNVELTALALHQPKELEAIRKTHPNIQSFMNIDGFYRSDIDIVDICLPTFLHKEYIQKTLEYGLDVICEKPLCRTLAEADELLELNRKYENNIYVAHVIRFWPEYVYLKNTIGSGRLGKLKSIYMGRYTGLPDWAINDWLVKQELSGGTPLDLQIHDLDFVLHALGTPDQVDVSLRENALHIWTHYRYEPDTMVVMEAGNDMPLSFGFEMQYHAIFEKGLIRFNSNQTPGLIEYNDQKKEEVNLEYGDEEKLDRHLPTGDAYLIELSHFIECSQKKKPSPIVSLESAANTVKMILKNLP